MLCHLWVNDVVNGESAKRTRLIRLEKVKQVMVNNVDDMNDYHKTLIVLGLFLKVKGRMSSEELIGEQAEETIES